MFIKYIMRAILLSPPTFSLIAGAFASFPHPSRSLDASHLAPLTLLGRKCSFSGPLKAGNKALAPRVTVMSWMKRSPPLPPTSEQREQASNKYAVCALAASAAYKEFAPVDPSFLFLDKRQELSG